MKLSESSYILIMSLLQTRLDIASKDKDNKKVKKLQIAMQELLTIGTY